MRISVTYEEDWGFGWIAAEPAHMRRGSHALADGGGVWLVDPVDGDGLADRIAAHGTVRGVIQLLDRHRRDCAALAARHGAPLHRIPLGVVPGSPLEAVRVIDRPWWRESAIWWPGRRALAVGDAIGTAPYFLAPGAALGVHPLLRLTPPRALEAFEPLHLLPGHGEPVSGEAVPGLVHRAVSGGRREIPRWLAGLPRAFGRGRDG
jgi:hypothetical protein